MIDNLIRFDIVQVDKSDYKADYTFGNYTFFHGRNKHKKHNDQHDNYCSSDQLLKLYPVLLSVYSFVLDDPSMTVFEMLQVKYIHSNH